MPTLFASKLFILASAVCAQAAQIPRSVADACPNAKEVESKSITVNGHEVVHQTFSCSDGHLDAEAFSSAISASSIPGLSSLEVRSQVECTTPATICQCGIAGLFVAVDCTCFIDGTLPSESDCETLIGSTGVIASLQGPTFMVQPKNFHVISLNTCSLGFLNLANFTEEFCWDDLGSQGNSLVASGCFGGNIGFTSGYSRARSLKQEQRERRIASCPSLFHVSLSDTDRAILSEPISSIVSNVQSGVWKPLNVLHAYGRKALAVHAQTNCLTEVMLEDADTWARDLDNDKIRKAGPLAGVPVSLKDTCAVAGYDACIGYAAWVGKPVQKDSALVRLLKDAGAIPFVKTAIPTTLLSFESYSGVFGRANNPHNTNYSPGGSSGGEAALLAAGGSRVGIGTDVAGSVRVPAHYSGIYSVRASAGRFPRSGNVTSIPGQEGVPAVYSPMARTLEDLETFWAAVFKMEPWKYDHSVTCLPWRPVELTEKVRFGVMWSDDVVPLSPACKRALQSVVDNLKCSGHEVIDFNAPDPYEGQKIASQLLLADGGETANHPILPFEPNDPGVAVAYFWLRLPRIFQRVYAWWVRYVQRDPVFAGIVEGFHKKTVVEYYKLVAEREAYRAKWHEAWNNAGLDFLLTAPNALPAVPHGGMKTGWKVCGYTFLFNLLDYTAGVQPITRVSASLDALPSPIPAHLTSNAIAKDAFAMYDAAAMDGLPVGVQAVGRRLEEEKVLAGMRLVEKVMRDHQEGYHLLGV
ncbi:hypothetical protein ACEPAF_2341 [Sanghuangporus sanghuang]